MSGPLNPCSPNLRSLQTLETIGAQLAMHYGASKETMGAFASVFGDLANFPQRLAQRLVDACKSNGVAMDK